MQRIITARTGWRLGFTKEKGMVRGQDKDRTSCFQDLLPLQKQQTKKKNSVFLAQFLELAQAYHVLLSGV